MLWSKRKAELRFRTLSFKLPGVLTDVVQKETYNHTKKGTGTQDLPQTGPDASTRSGSHQAPTEPLEEEEETKEEQNDWIPKAHSCLSHVWT